MVKKEVVVSINTLGKKWKIYAGEITLVLLATNILIIVSVNLISSWLLPFYRAEIIFTAYLLVLMNFKFSGKIAIITANLILLAVALAKLVGMEAAFNEESVLVFYLYLTGLLQICWKKLR